MEQQIADTIKTIESNQALFNRSFSERATKYKLQRMEQIQSLLQQLDGQTQNRSHNYFQEYMDIIRRMSVYKEFPEYFLGNFGSLGYIGNFVGDWPIEKQDILNSELTSWLGETNMRRVVISCERHLAFSENLIDRVKEEMKQQQVRGVKLHKLPREADVQSDLADNDDPQRLIKLPPVSATGFIGYAVNLIYLDQKQLDLNLRVRQWYPSLRRTMVFETTANLSTYCTKARGPVHAFTLDG